MNNFKYFKPISENSSFLICFNLENIMHLVKISKFKRSGYNFLFRTIRSQDFVIRVGRIQNIFL